MSFFIVFMLIYPKEGKVAPGSTALPCDMYTIIPYVHKELCFPELIQQSVNFKIKHDWVAECETLRSVGDLMPE